jgi:hypothetical protein
MHPLGDVSVVRPDPRKLPREEPWLLAGGEEHPPVLVAIRCKFCDAEIRLTDE